jgi:NodT family efflux transporter outer membrane factor (OMF) lipoprotein
VCGGCVRIPESEVAVAEPSLQIAKAVGEAIRDGSFEAGEWIEPKWWERFEDPVLTGLIERGIRTSPSLGLARERLRAAAQVALQKEAALYPELDLDAFDFWGHLSKAGFFRAFAPTIPAVVNDFYVGLSFSYEFDFWGKNRDLMNAALGEAAASAAEAMQAELIMTTSIAYTYFELQFFLKKKEILEARKRNRHSVTAVTERRLEGALDTSFEPLEARADTLDIEAEIQELEIEIAAHIHKLKALSGMQQDETLEVRTVSPKPLRLGLPPKLGLDLIGRRPDLIALRRRMEAAGKEVDAAKTDFYPNINLRAILGTESVFWSKLFRGDSWDAAALPALHLPIFTAGRIRAQLYEKLADFNQAVYSYNQLILDAANEIADSLTKISKLLQEIETRKTALNVALSQEAIVMRRYLGAVAAYSDTLDAEDKVLQKRLVLAAVEYGTQLSEIDLVRVLGGGFHE